MFALWAIAKLLLAKIICSRELARLHDPAQLDFDLMARMHLGAERDLPGPLERLFHRANLDDPVLNDALGKTMIQGACTYSHNAPDVGDHSVALPLDLGLSDASRRTPDLPLYALRNKKTGETFQTTDPGRALITGAWHDLSRFKGPILRGLAARAPYFHNGSAATLGDAVEFYDTRFAIGFTEQEKSDLVAFSKHRKFAR